MNSTSQQPHRKQAREEKKNTISAAIKRVEQLKEETTPKQELRFQDLNPGKEQIKGQKKMASKYHP